MKAFLKPLVQFMTGLVKKNFWMKIAALGFAAALWVFVIAETNPSRIKEFRDIPVSFTGVQEINNRGLTSVENLSELLAEADATVDAQTDQLKYLTDENITLTVDLSGITTPGEYTLPIRGRSTAGNVTRMDPSNVTVTVEDIASVELPVEVQLVGDKNPNLYYGEPTLSKGTGTVSGARSNLEAFAKAVCYLDIEGLTGPVTESKNAVVIDENGNIVDEASIDDTIPSVIVSLDIYPKKTVPIDTQLVTQAITGVAPGYQIDGVVLEPESVEFAGPQDILDSISSAELQPIELAEGATADASLKALVIVPDGVVASEPPEVSLTVKISQILESITYEAVDIGVKNLDSDLEYELTPQSIDVTVTGSPDVLDEIQSSQIKPFVDLSNLGIGTHTVTVKFEDAPDIDATLVPSALTVQVNLTPANG
jgi:YbbR domain-containing protein